MLVLQRVGVFVGDRDLVKRPEGLVALDDVEAAGIGAIKGCHAPAVQLEDQGVQVGVGGQQAHPLQESFLGGTLLGRDVLVVESNQVLSELVPTDELVGHRRQRIQLADRRHLRDNRVDLRSQGRIDRCGRRCGGGVAPSCVLTGVGVAVLSRSAGGKR